MSGITPGPWTVTENDLRDGRYWTVRTSAPDHEPIDIHDDDNGEANARAIAALPEMMEALEALVNAEALSKVEDIVAGWKGPPEKPYSPHPPQLGARIETTCGRVYKLDEAMKAARSALAKAKGETP